MPSEKSVPPQLRFRRIFRSTQIVASETFILFSTLACAKELSLLTSISGLWQFEDKSVWVLTAANVYRPCATPLKPLGFTVHAALHMPDGRRTHGFPYQSSTVPHAA
jgi:hypothetical protein